MNDTRPQLPSTTARLLATVGIAYPILQAPIGGSAGAELAAAVSEGGGLGALALTWTPPSDAIALVRAVAARSRRPFQANYVLARPPESLDAVLDAGAPVITFSWGHAGPYTARVRAAGAKCGVQVSTVRGALMARDAGADFIVCQGVEAGGHVQASRSLRDTLQDILACDAMPPVVAAGGIADGAAAAAVIAAGAAGAMLGTRFVATEESLAHPAYKQAIVGARRAESVLTVCFDGGWPYAAQRVLRNGTLDAWESAGSPPHGSRPGEDDAVAVKADGALVRRYDDTIPLATMRGDVTDMALYAGLGCDAIRDIPPAGALVRRLWAECAAVLNATE